jgi:hypothetical protein
MAANRDNYGHGRQGPDYCRAKRTHRGTSTGNRRTQTGFGQGDQGLFELVQVGEIDLVQFLGLAYVDTVVNTDARKESSFCQLGRCDRRRLANLISPRRLGRPTL